MNVLVKGTNWLGDAVMSLPTIVSLRRMFPRAKVSVLTRRAFADLYRASGDVDEILPYDRKRRLARIPSAVMLARDLRRKRFDAALLLPRSFSSAMLAFTARIPVRIGYRGEGRSAFLTRALDRTRDLLGRHRVHYYHHLLTALGEPPPADPPRLTPDREARAWAASVLPAGGPIVVLNPGATYGAAKQWYPDRFTEVASRLRRRHRARIVVIGGPSESELAERICRTLGDDAISLAGRTSVLQLAAVLEASRLLLTNDTGPMHVADAVGTPLVAVFGPTDPVTTPPFGRRHTIVRHDLECSPCLRRECPLGHHNCMKLVTADEVTDACRKWLES